jgi:hypothetical protein
VVEVTQSEELQHNLGDFLVGYVDDVRWWTPHFTGTWYEYLPFLTYQLGYGMRGMELADRQNLYSMKIALKGLIELFKLARLEVQINRQVLGFSIPCDLEPVRIWAHYPMIYQTSVRFFCHSIYHFSFTAGNGKERYTAFKFTKNVYNAWVPIHFKGICSALDALTSSLSAGHLLELAGKFD